MRHHHTSLFALAAMLVWPAGMGWAAEEAAPAEGPAVQRSAVITDLPYPPMLATRFGGWGLHTSGSKAGVGEWQGLDESSPFWDVDGLFTNGYRTVDLFATGVENESTQAGVEYYHGPGLSLDVDYDRFLHRLGHDPVGGPADANGFPPQGGFYNPPLPAGDPGSAMFGEDLNVGQDYAIRVQQMKANFTGRLSKNVRWRLNVWGMKKEGTRQANSHQHCFTRTPAPGGPACHVVSQGQRIDWLTMEIEPVIEARFDWLTAEYSHTFRSFQQNDQMVLNDFTSFGSFGFQADGAYAHVPENITEIDRVKLHGQLDQSTELYVLGHVGNTHNKFRESDRKFYGVDARLMNRSFKDLSLTVYGKTFTQNSSADTMALNDRYPAQADVWHESVPPQDFYTPTSLYLGQVDRQFTKLGVKGRWRPFLNSHGLARRTALTGGYEYGQTERDNVTYDLQSLTPPILFTQPTTITNRFSVGLQQEWSWALNSYIRYRMIDNEWPLVGVARRQQLSLDTALNSNQPEHEDRIEIGGTWNPSSNFLMNASFWIQSAYNHQSGFVNFDEDDYPIVVSAWYAPDQRWSFSGGFATFSNWINQDITLGGENGEGPPGELPAWTSAWRYRGRANVLNLGATYVVSCRTVLTGGFEYGRSWNRFDTPPSPPTADPDYSDLPGYSRVRVDTYRIVAGVDHELTQTFNSFLRYNYFDYDDRAMAYNAGQAHMFLGGMSAVF